MIVFVLFFFGENDSVADINIQFMTPSKFHWVNECVCVRKKIVLIEYARFSLLSANNWWEAKQKNIWHLFMYRERKNKNYERNFCICLHAIVNKVFIEYTNSIHVYIGCKNSRETQVSAIRYPDTESNIRNQY